MTTSSPMFEKASKPMTPERQEIIRRRNAIDASELDEHRKFARAILRIKTARKYVEDCCEHPETKKVFQISHHITVCCDCNATIKAKEQSNVSNQS